MWRRFSGSLTLRIFLITAAMLAAACAITYGALAYLTPITYTAMLEDELDAAAGELLDALRGTIYAESEVNLRRFTRETGATATVVLTDAFALVENAPGVSVEAQDAGIGNSSEEIAVTDAAMAGMGEESDTPAAGSIAEDSRIDSDVLIASAYARDGDISGAAHMGNEKA